MNYYYIEASGDDGHVSTGTVYSTSSNTAYIGYNTSTGYRHHAWFLFSNVNIPVGSTITYAGWHPHLTNAASSVTIDIYYEKETNATAITSNADYYTRNLTTAHVGGYTLNEYTGEWITLSGGGILTGLQEIIDQPGWSYGNDIMMMVKDSGTSTDKTTVQTYDAGPGQTYGCKLYVQFQAPDTETINIDLSTSTVKKVNKIISCGIDLSSNQVLKNSIINSNSIDLSTSKIIKANKIINDSIDISNSIVKDVSIIQSNTIDLSESIVKDVSKNVNDSIDLSESLVKDVSKNITTNIDINLNLLKTVNITLLDYLTNSISLNKKSSININDSIDTLISKNVKVSINQTTNIDIDSEVKKKVNKTINLSEYINSILIKKIGKIENLGVNSSIIYNKKASIIKDTLTYIDTQITKDITKYMSDTIDLTSNTIKKAQIIQNDTIDLSNNLSKKVGIIETNVIELTPGIKKDISKYIDLNISLLSIYEYPIFPVYTFYDEAITMSFEDEAITMSFEDEEITKDFNS